jgi:hypothetical protein
LTTFRERSDTKSNATPAAATGGASVRTIFHLWLPLAVSFELMMLEGPAFHGAIGRLPDAPLHLAAWGLTMAISLIIESPVIMLLATSIALVRNADSYRALKTFMVRLCWGCTAICALIAFTPLFDLISIRMMGQPAPIVQAARPALQIMLFWTAAIGWRRFYQGILVRHGQTRLVSYGTAVRLAAAVITAAILVKQGSVPGVQVAAIAIMAAVVSEAVVTTLFARPLLRRDILPKTDSDEPPLTQSEIYRFHLPLAATTLLTLLAQPLTAAALARLEKPAVTLAAWPVAYMILLVIRGGGLALQEITVSLARQPVARPALLRFTWLLGIASSLFTLIFAFTPLLDLYLFRVIEAPGEIAGEVRIGMMGGVILQLFTALGSWARGLLVYEGRTKLVYRGMGISLLSQSALLTVGVLLRLPGMWVAMGAMTAASVVEYLYLARQCRRREEV